MYMYNYNKLLTIRSTDKRLKGKTWKNQRDYEAQFRDLIFKKDHSRVISKRKEGFFPSVQFYREVLLHPVKPIDNTRENHEVNRENE